MDEKFYTFTKLTCVCTHDKKINCPSLYRINPELIRNHINAFESEIITLFVQYIQ